MAVGHLEFLAIYDYDTYQTHYSIPVDIPLGHKVFGTVTYHNDTEFARTMTCKVVFADPQGYPVPSKAKEYTEWVPAYGHKTAATDPITLNKAGTWKIVATLDGFAVVKSWNVINVPVEEWQEVETMRVTLVPEEGIVGEWQCLETVTVTLTPTGVPPPTCTVDADCEAPTPYCVGGVCVECRTSIDCPEGYACKDGKCVKEAVFPWQWLAIGGAAIAGVILLIPKKAKEKIK